MAQKILRSRSERQTIFCHPDEGRIFYSVKSNRQVKPLPVCNQKVTIHHSVNFLCIIKTDRFIFVPVMTKAERTRQFIIEKAAPIFNKKGMAGTAISDIMEATKLAKGGVYGNFESKDEICLEAFNYLTRNLSAALNQSMEGKTSAKDKLFSLFDFYKDRLFKSPNGGCPILNFGTEADDTNPVIKKRVVAAIENSQSRIANVVKQGVESGEFKPTFDAAIFAVKAFTMLEGAILISRVQSNNSHMILITDLLKAEIEQNTI